MMSGRYINLSKLMWIKLVVSLVTVYSKDISSCIVCNFLLLIIALQMYIKDLTYAYTLFILLYKFMTTGYGEYTIYATGYLLYCIIYGEVF